ncbi:MAG TPA: hypothetical protein VKE42_02420, partial [Candidatus Cybelea sp.]|nr:hypothetical protein [Candidatus Cybelea sp.]
MPKPRIVVTGFAGLLPFGGVAWDYAQYARGFADLGCDVMYLEDTREWPTCQDPRLDSTFNVSHLSATMEYFGLADRWAYRDEVSGRCYGMSESAVREFCRSADILVNVSCSATLRDEYRSIPVRALIDTDPMFTQIQHVTGVAMCGGQGTMRDVIASHTHFFTLGENIGSPDCRIPTLGLHWYPTRPPVVLRFWPVTDPPAADCGAYTTVMNWSVFDELEFDGEHWGQKNAEFMRFLDLPHRVRQIRLGIAVSQPFNGIFPLQLVREAGWTVVDPDVCVPDARAYQNFVKASRGEFSVAKQTYVRANTGWFSCRSACYLAAGRPVIVQDTGWSRILPNGRGLLAFSDTDTAVDALRSVEADPYRHAKAARAIAEEWFASERVLDEMLTCMGSEA